MSLGFFIFIIFAIGIFSLWTYRYVIRPRIEKRCILREIYTPQIAGAHHLFNQLYQNIDGGKISKVEQKRLQLTKDALVYGEMIFESFVLILQFVKPQPEDVFYDLGCGTGKAVIAASLLYKFKKAYGVEILPGMHSVCERQLMKLKQLIKQTPQIKNNSDNVAFIHGDILHVDFSDADIVYVNSTAFFDKLWEAIVITLCELKSGARVIVTSRYLPEDQFELLDDRRRLMSWGMNTVRIYRKK